MGKSNNDFPGYYPVVEWDTTFRFSRYFDFKEWHEPELVLGDFHDVRVLDDPPLMLLAVNASHTKVLVMEPDGYVGWMGTGWIREPESVIFAGY